MTLHTASGRTWKRGLDSYGNDYVLELPYAPLDAPGEHEIRFVNTDYYHIHNGRQTRLQRRDLYGLLAHVQNKYGQECAGIDDNGRFGAEWQVGGEPVDELERYLLGA